MNALFISIAASQRDSVELLKYLDVDCRILTPGSHFKHKKGWNALGNYSFYWPELTKTEEEIAREINNELDKNYDIIFMGALPSWDVYHEDIREKIILNIQKGACLYIFNPKDQFVEYIRSKATPEILPELNFHDSDDEHSSIQLFVLEKGKVFIVNNNTDPVNGYLIGDSEYHGDYEYKLYKLADIIFKCVRGINILAKPIINNNKIKLIPSHTVDTNLRYQLYIYDMEFKLICRSKFIKSDEWKGYSFNLNNLAEGQYFAAYHIYKGNSIVSYAGRKFDITHKSSIKHIELNTSEYRIGDTIIADIQYEHPVDNLKIKYFLQDNYGRIFFKNDKNKLVERLRLQIPNGSMTIINYLYIELFKNNNCICGKHIEFTIPRNYTYDDFYVFIWSNYISNTWRQKSYFQILRKNGVDGLVNTPRDAASARIAYLHNLHSIPYSSWLHAINLPDNLFNQSWIDKTYKDVEETARSYSRYGGFAFTLGDEPYVDPFHPEGRFFDRDDIWTEFRKFLQGTYRNISSLNSQWDKTYINFDEIRFGKESEMLIDKDNPSPWVDYRLFVSSRFIKIMKTARDRIRQILPETFVGYDGTENFSSYDGFDWYKMAQEFDLNQTYVNNIVSDKMQNKMFNGQCIRSFKNNRSLTGAFMNNINFEKGPEHIPWYLLFSGFYSLWWWTGTNLGYEVDAFDYNYNPTPVFERILKTASEIKKGACSVIKNAEPVKDQIALYYSPVNWHASTLSSGIGNHINNLGFNLEKWFDNNFLKVYDNVDQEADSGVSTLNSDYVNIFRNMETCGHYASSFKNFLMILQDIAVDPVVTCPELILKNQLDKIKVLILPFTEAISIEEVVLIKKFVENGGVLITDYRCALRDKHCKFYNNGGALDDIFGIKQEKEHSISKAVTNIRVSKGDQKNVYEAEYTATFTAPKTSLTSGTALGSASNGTPVYICNEYGKGKTLFLNTDIYSYIHLRSEGREYKMRELFRKLLCGYANYKAKKYVKDSYGNPAPHIQNFDFTNKEIIYRAVINDTAVNKMVNINAVIKFDAKGHVYELRSKKYYGMQNQISEPLEPGIAKIYTVLPYRIKKLLSRGSDKVKRGEVLSVIIELIADHNAITQEHIVHVEVYNKANPEGVFYLEKNIEIQKGKGAYNFPVEYNAAKGLWTILFEEVITGIKNEYLFEVY